MGLTVLQVEIANPATPDVIFGEEDDSILLGALTLESLGLALDPLKRELRPLPMVLGGLRQEAH